MNPVCQTTLIFQDFQPGRVNRASRRLSAAGGKGIHAARAANILQAESCAVAHFTGGTTGAYIAAEMEKEEIPQWNVSITDSSRGCTTILDQGDETMTELVEPSPAVTAAELTRLREILYPHLSRMKAIALCGTLPSGCGSNIYTDIIEQTQDAWVLLDAWRDAAPCLEAGNIDILKVNALELQRITRRETFEAAVKTCRTQFPVPWVAVTAGPDVAGLYGPHEGWEFRLPKLKRVVNPLGAGDTVTGIMLRKLADGSGVRDAFIAGLAAATASCKDYIGARFTVAEMIEYRNQIDVVPASYQLPIRA